MRIMERLFWTLLSMMLGICLAPFIPTFFVKHWVISIFLLIASWPSNWGYGSDRGCKGCPDCDPQAFIDEDGEIDPGIHRLTRR